MKTTFTSLGQITVVALFGCVVSTTAQIIIPVTAGNIAGGGNFPASTLFDSQPTAPITNPYAGGGAAINYNNATAGNVTGYIDFGTNFSLYQISETWTAYFAFTSITTPVPFVDLFWSDSITLTRGAPGTFQDETVLNFGTTVVPNGGVGTRQWIRDVDLNATPFTVPFRYLITSIAPGSFAAYFGNGRAVEIAFVGQTVVVPEPGTYLLLGSGLLVLFLVRRRWVGVENNGS
jgi:hypothetical protein